MGRILWVMAAMMLSVAMADVPMLDASSVKKPEKRAVNKCVDPKGAITYTQFACDDASTAAKEGWIEETNITYANGRQSKRSVANTMPDHTNDSGLEILQSSFENHSFWELFSEGIKSMATQRERLRDI